MERGVLPVALALGCGPIAGTNDAATTAAAIETSTTGALETSPASEDLGDSTAAGGWADCPSVSVDGPFAYRAYCLVRDGELPNVAGRLGLGGAPSFAFIGGQLDTPWAKQTTLIGWDGVQLTEQRIDTVEYADPWLTAVLSDPQRDDLVGDALAYFVPVIPNSVHGLDSPLSTGFSPPSRSPIAAIDLDDDGLDELVVAYDDGFVPIYLKAYRWNGVAWGWWANLDGSPNGCPITQAKRIELDGDGRGDLVLVSSCNWGGPLQDALVTMVLTSRPPGSTRTLWPAVDGTIAAWHLADFDADGRQDMIYEVVDGGPRRLEIVLVPGDGTLSPPVAIALDGVALFVDGVNDCAQTDDEWIPLDADGDGRSELMCGRTILTSLLDAPVAVEAFAAEPFGGRVGPRVVAHDLSGDGVDEIVISGRDAAGEPRAFVLISGQ